MELLRHIPRTFPFAITVGDPEGDSDATTRDYVDSAVYDLTGVVAEVMLASELERSVGDIVIRYTDIDFTDTAASTAFFFPSGGRKFAATAAWIVPTAVSSANGDAAAQIDNGTSGQDIFASKTLSDPAVGQLIPFSLSSAPYLADASNPLRLRRTIADSGVTFIGDLYVKGDYNT